MVMSQYQHLVVEAHMMFDFKESMMCDFKGSSSSSSSSSSSNKTYLSIPNETMRSQERFFDLTRQLTEAVLLGKGLKHHVTPPACPIAVATNMTGQIVKLLWTLIWLIVSPCRASPY